MVCDEAGMGGEKTALYIMIDAWRIEAMVRMNREKERTA